MRSCRASFLLLVLPAALLVGCRDSDFERSCGDTSHGTVICTESGFRRCWDGDWVNGSCEGGCFKGTCGTSQCPDERLAECSSDGALRICDPSVGGWEQHLCGMDEVCVIDACETGACSSGTRYCEGNTAVQCSDDGSETEVIENCPADRPCNDGICLSACEDAERSRSFVGCSYYSLDTDNDSGDGFTYRNDEAQSDVVIANPSLDRTASVTFEERIDGTWEPVTTVVIPPRAVQVTPLTCTTFCASGNLRPDRHIEDTGYAAGYAFRIVSDAPIVPYQFNNDDLDGHSSSSSATVLMPRTVLDLQYFALTLPQAGNDRAWVAVVGTEDGTSVTITVTDTTVGGGGIPGLAAGESFTIDLDEGDVAQISTASTGDDLSGTLVEADAPVAVFAGNECARQAGGSCHTGSNGGDHTTEQLMPVTTWGKEFVAAHVRHPQQIPQDRATWKIVAWAEGTELTFEEGKGVSGLPSPTTLGRGQVLEFTTMGSPGHFSISATEAVMVMQFLHGEEAAILLIPKEQFLPDYVFQAPPFFEDTLVLTRPLGTSVLLDGSEIGGVVWNATGAGYEGAWLDALPDGTHEVSVVSSVKGSNPGIQIVGMDENCSYGYVAGGNAALINPIE